jgi:hypothetical protein
VGFDTRPYGEAGIRGSAIAYAWGVRLLVGETGVWEEEPLCVLDYLFLLL